LFEAALGFDISLNQWIGLVVERAPAIGWQCACAITHECLTSRLICLQFIDADDSFVLWLSLSFQRVAARWPLWRHGRRGICRTSSSD